LLDRGVHSAKRPLIPQKYGEADYLIRAEQNLKQKYTARDDCRQIE